jgi:hypothetical protein
MHRRRVVDSNRPAWLECLGQLRQPIFAPGKEPVAMNDGDAYRNRLFFIRMESSLGQKRRFIHLKTQALEK